MEFGIEEFISGCFPDDVKPPSGELPCVFKRMYSDFIVVEIDPSGNVLLPSKEPSDEAKEKRQNEKEGPKGETPDEGPPSAKRPRILSDELLSKLEELLEKELDEPIFVDLKEISKENRKEIYDYLSRSYGRKLKTQCKDGQLAISRFKKGDTFDERSRWTKDRGHYVHFTLTKMNMESYFALKTIARKLNLNPAKFSTAGTKDRRAITTQRVSAFRIEKERLAKIARSLKNIWLSDFAYSKWQLCFGQHAGNHFSIVLREFPREISEEDFGKRVDFWAKNGFLNYFGFQRFGSFGVNTAEIGRLILLGEWENAVNMILTPNRDVDTSSPIYKCLKVFHESRNPRLALTFLTCNYFSIECAILRILGYLMDAKEKAFAEEEQRKMAEEEGIAEETQACYKPKESAKAIKRKEENIYKSVIMEIPREARSLYLHAYQSFVFNRIATRRIKEFGLSVLPGDLDKEENPFPIPKPEEDCGQSEKPTLADVYLPLPVADCRFPDNKVGEWYAELLTADGLSLEAFSRIDKKQFILGATYRPFVVQPKNVKWEFVEYSGVYQELQTSEFIVKNGPTSDEKSDESENSQENGEKEEESEEVGELGEEEAVLDVLEEPDEEGEEPTEGANESANKNKEGEKANSLEAEPPSETSKNGQSEGRWKALKISFDLPPGSYATIALRELLHTDLSKNTQRSREFALTGKK